MFLAVLVANLLLGTPQLGLAFVDDPDPAPLRGAARRVRVEVGDLGADAARLGFSPKAVGAVVRKQLAAAGFTVTEAAEAAVFVAVGIFAVRGAGLYAYSIRYFFDQPVRLGRDGAQRFSAPTWVLGHTDSAKLSAAVLGSVQRLGARSAVHQQLRRRQPAGGIKLFCHIVIIGGTGSPLRWTGF